MNGRPSQHSRHSSTSNASSTSSSNVSLSLSILSESSDGVDERDPADESPLRRTVTGNTSSSSATGYSTVTLGLRSFSNTHHTLNTAQRIAKESLPSPPSTSKGESEKGSIGSANSLQSPAISSIKGSYAQKRSDARPSLREMQLTGTDGLGSPDEVKTARPAVQQMLGSPTDLMSAAIPSPSPAPRLSLDNSRGDYIAAREPRSRSASPLAAKAVIQRASPVISRSNSRVSLDLHNNGDIAAKDMNEREVALSPVLSRNSSIRSTLSRAGSIKGKAREDGPEAGNRTPSISASKIRRISEETRQRMYRESAQAAQSPTGNSSYHSIDTNVESPSSMKPSRKDSLTVSKMTQDSQAMRRQSSSSSSSHASPSQYQSARSNSGSASSDSSPVIKRSMQFPSASGAGARPSGETAFARTNRNSVISVHAREVEIPISPANSDRCPDHTTGESLNGQHGGQTKRGMRQNPELEEGEILSETPPRSVNLSEAASTRYPPRSSPIEIDHPRDTYQVPSSSRMSKQSSGSTGSENRDFARQSLRRSGLLDDAAMQSRLSLGETYRPPSASPTRRQQRQERSEKHTRVRYPAVRPSLSVLDLPRENEETEQPGQGQIRAPFSERGSGISASSKDRYQTNEHRPVTPVMPRAGDEQDITPSRRRSQVSMHHDRYARHTPRSADIERQIDNTVNTSRDRSVDHASILSRRSQTALSQYSDRISASAGIPSPRQPRDFPRTATDEASSPFSRHEQRRLRHSHSPDRRTVASASRQAITNNYLRRDRSSAGSEAYAPSALQRQSHTEQTSPGSRRSPPNDRLRTMSRIDSSTDLKEVLGRVRARTLSAQDAGNAAAVRARSEAGRDRHDVFTNNQRQIATPDKYRTIASDRPRTSASIRDMQIASQGWWEEVNELRRNPTSARNERPASRAGTSYSGKSREDQSSTLSPESKTDSSYSERRTSGRLATTTPNHERAGSDHPVQSRAGRQYTPVDNELIDTRQYTPTSRPISRNRTAEQTLSSRNVQSRMATPSLQPEKEVGKHQAMLLEALEAFSKHQSMNPNSASISAVATSIVASAGRMSLTSKEMVDQLITARIEQEVASDNESAVAHTRQPRRDMLMARVERSANACHRTSNEQIRNLTELFLMLALSTQTRENNGQPQDSTAPGRRTESGHNNGSVRKSQTVGMHHSRSSLAALALPSSSISPNHQSSTRPASEDILEALPRFGQERMQNEPLGDAHSPRTLRRAKSSSTSQVSQSTVRGYLATSPSRSSTDSFYANTSSQDRSSRRSSLASIEGSFVTDNSATAILVSPQTAEATHMLEQLSHNDRPEATPASRWRTFGRKNAQPSEELPDSPSFATISRRQASDTQHRSSELAKTLSRVSSVYRPRRQK